MKQSFQNRFIAFLNDNDLIRQSDRVLVAVSGGKDSMTLLHCLSLVQKEFDLCLAVAHVHHGLRGDEADQDERFVRDAVRALGIPFYALRVNVPDHVQKTGCSIEESARELRYEALKSLRQRVGFDRIALGHHADDQAETILLNLMRGTGIRGLGGMHPQRGGLIRPFLFASRSEIDAFASEAKIPFRFDASNADKRFPRNRLRLDVIPVLKAAFGESVTQTLCRDAENVREIDAYVRLETEKAWPLVAHEKNSTEIALEIEPFLRYFKLIQKSMAALAVEKLTGRASFFTARDYDRVLCLAKKGRSGGGVLFHQEVRVVRSGGNLVFIRRIPEVTSHPVEVNQTIRIPELRLAIRTSVMEVAQVSDLKRHDRNTEYVDRERIDGPLTIREVRSGDSFIPLGMRGRKKLHDFFVDEKVPRYRRRAIPLFCAGDDIVWIAGYRIDDRFKVTHTTKTILKLELLDDPNSEG